jgi:hypothetical protein
VDFDVTGQLLIRYFTFIRYSKNRSTMRQYIHVYFTNAYESVTREVMYDILIEFGLSMKLVRLIKCV